MEIKTEAADNDINIIDRSHADRPNAGVFAVSRALFSAFCAFVLCLRIHSVSRLSSPFLFFCDHFPNCKLI